MPNFFYYDENSQKQGPVTQQELKNLVDQGLITPETPLETDTGHKGNAGQVNGLFPAPEDLFANPQPQYEQSSYLPPPAARPPKDYFIWSIITTLCCCVPLGIIAIVMSVQAKSAFQIGDYAGYESKTKTAFWCNLISLIGGSLLWVAYVILACIGAVADANGGNF